MRDPVTDTGKIYEKPMIRKKFRTNGKAKKRKQQIRKSVKRMTETEEAVSSNVISRETKTTERQLKGNCKRSLSFPYTLFVLYSSVFKRYSICFKGFFFLVNHGIN